MIFAFDERAERVAAATALPPATKRASAAGTRRGGPEPELLRGQRHELVEADRLVVRHVVDLAGARALARQTQRRCDVLDVHHVPQVLAAADHREASRLAQTGDQLLRVPPAGPVHVRRANHDRGQA